MRKLTIPTPRGDVHCEQFGDPASRAIVWVFGAGGGFGGPAGGLYSRLGNQFAKGGTYSLCLDYLHPGRLDNCIGDLRAGVEYLVSSGTQHIVLVGHSFGGAVVIQTALAFSSSVVAVAALSSQSFGTSGVERLSPRPLLLVHGEQDEILPPVCSRDIYQRAKQPKELILYPGCRHGLDECVQALDRDLTRWIFRSFETAGTTRADSTRSS